MAKNKKKNFFDDLVEITAAFPWWAGIISAIVSWLVLHRYAKFSPSTPTNVAGLTDVVQGTLISTICTLLQYVVPVAFLIGSLLSVKRSNASKLLLVSARASSADEKLRSFSWREFEVLVGQAFRERGYSVRQLGGNGPDGGVDLELRMGSDKYFVQCKHWKTLAVGVAPVRELFGVMSAEGAIGGFVVASGTFTVEAEKFAKGRSIELIKAGDLVQLQHEKSSVRTVDTNTAVNPVCPRCNEIMVKRQAHKGMNAGNDFWGCSAYPRCRGILPMHNESKQ